MFMVFAIIEFGHAQMVNNVLNSACRNGARLGSVEGTTTAQVLAQVDQTISNVVSSGELSILVKDASVYDTGGTPPNSASEFDDLNLSEAEPRQLFLIHASVPYNDIALISMPFMEGVVLTSQSFMRHE